MISSSAGRGGGAGLRFTFALGGGKTEVTVEGDVANGMWHTVEVEYFNRVSLLQKLVYCLCPDKLKNTKYRNYVNWCIRLEFIT